VPGGRADVLFHETKLCNSQSLRVRARADDFRRKGTMSSLVLLAAIFCSSALSGMLGIGVAFAAIPLLGSMHLDFVQEAQPVALLLNGVSALAAAACFSRAGLVDWPRAVRLSAVATAFTPLGALLAFRLDAHLLWAIYYVMAGAAICLVMAPRATGGLRWGFGSVLLACAPLSVLSGMLGVGPGLVLVPLMVFARFRTTHAAAINAVAMVPASFAALVPHLGSPIAQEALDMVFIAPACVAAAAGAWLGSRMCCGQRLSASSLRRLLVVVVLSLSLYQAVAMQGGSVMLAESGAECARPALLLAAPGGKFCS
jgi:uncharacterized membrane protein YfcA